MVRQEAATLVRDLREDPAYRSGWEDGRFGLSPLGYPSDAEAATEFSTDFEQRAYHHGHQEGRRIQQMLRVDAGHI